ncbi:MAG: branched-chain amino acid ABC transporter permease [Nitrospinaceae bacterium]|nr:branched-chain amino acid ABC transporter permease [Nitrospinaceae bacterium]MBT3432867.1 branched-chain amino acid ABC transporter permease [Nitrospinaceae bacterium]MBT3821265.1 branched-chain amino acid ABC transporter permease [Nitrospinaceae bacterium]MBT4094076.1 branched-chain amino acid ABC transporter permease [Nitrospinaceae bacterium]MBT4432353.1 branched-chain amino acid ABC transporter permease [Nitrospinaceae bacterium]
MATDQSASKFKSSDFCARILEILDNYGILILGAFLAVYPFMFQGLNDLIYWSEDFAEWLTPTLSFIRGFVPSTPLMIQILIYSLFGMAFNILLGNTGMLSLGHSAYFGIGGYTLGLMHAWFKKGTPPPSWISETFAIAPLEISIISAVLVSALFAYLIGLVASSKRGVYFAMVTLALSMVFYYAAQTFDDITGGTDGLGGLENMRLGTLNLRVGIMNANVTYYFIFIMTALTIAIVWQILRSPFGQVLRAVRENENRARNCGYNTAKVRLMAFTLSGSLAGLAGALAVIYGETVPIENIHFQTSGQIVIITLFGGAGVFLGPVVGSFIYWYLRQLMSTEFVKYLDIFQYWEAWVGGIFILIVLFLPNGILGTLRNWSVEYRAKHYMNKLEEAKAAKAAESQES